jgi:hypothetical protein
LILYCITRCHAAKMSVKPRNLRLHARTSVAGVSGPQWADWVTTVFSTTEEAVNRVWLGLDFCACSRATVSLGEGSMSSSLQQSCSFGVSKTLHKTACPDAFWLRIDVRNVFLAWSDATTESLNLARSTGPCPPHWRPLKYPDALKKNVSVDRLVSKSRCYSCHKSCIQNCCLFTQKSKHAVGWYVCGQIPDVNTAVCRTHATFASVAVRCRWKCMQGCKCLELRGLQTLCACSHWFH